MFISANWARPILDQPGIVFVEVDEDALAYDKGHIAAVKLDWKTELQDQVPRRIDKAGFEKLLWPRASAATTP